MRNGPYNLIVAPKDYPGSLYRQKYIYEHHYIYWKETGYVPKSDEIIHHKNGDRRDNRFENLELLPKISHISYHLERRKKSCDIIFTVCPVCFEIITRPKRNSHIVDKQKIYTCCNYQCSGALSTILKTVSPTEIFILQERKRICRRIPQES